MTGEEIDTYLMGKSKIFMKYRTNVFLLHRVRSSIQMQSSYRPHFLFSTGSLRVDIQGSSSLNQQSSGLKVRWHQQGYRSWLLLWLLRDKRPRLLPLSLQNVIRAWLLLTLRKHLQKKKSMSQQVRRRTHRSDLNRLPSHP